VIDRREFTSVLVANRGEIARRIIAGARRRGLRTVAVYTDADADAPHVREADSAVRLHGHSPAAAHLDHDQLIDAARRSNADAVHPGYGFVSESAVFAESVIDAGLVWIGPPPSAMAAMADKLAAKEVAARAGVPLPASAELTGDTPALWRDQAGAVGYPLLVKAAAGGGGRGMRLVTAEDDLADAVDGARREAAGSFGDATVFAERYLAGGRHIEIQVVADTHGNVVHLGERECSVQRRHQKVLEEAPSVAVTAALRQQMGAAAIELARAIDYVGVGTVEFLADDDGFAFLEMNTRLQVEHAVTEAVWGVDLVDLQFDIAAGHPLNVHQDHLELSGHAIEVRLYAEDPSRDWLPQTGTVTRWSPPTVPGLRVDAAVTTGSTVGTAFDAMVAKLIVHAPDRNRAARQLARVLDELEIHGVGTNRDLLIAIVRDPDFLAGATPTTFLDDHPALLTTEPPVPLRRIHLVAAECAERQLQRADDRHWPFVERGWRNVGASTIGALDWAEVDDDTRGDIADALTRAHGLDHAVETGSDGICRVRVELDHETVFVQVHDDGQARWMNSPGGQTHVSRRSRWSDATVLATAGSLSAPVPGRIVAVTVVAGDTVTAGQTLMVLEAMKVEHRITAPGEGIVEAVLVAPGDTVDAHQVLAQLSDLPSPAPASDPATEGTPR
jgi:3-methylcrotonyl-CoA carboxylase alpha subunit